MKKKFRSVRSRRSPIPSDNHSMKHGVFSFSTRLLSTSTQTQNIRLSVIERTFKSPSTYLQIVLGVHVVLAAEHIAHHYQVGLVAVHGQTVETEVLREQGLAWKWKRINLRISRIQYQYTVPIHSTTIPHTQESRKTN